MSDWQYDETECTNCGHYPTRWRRCDEYGCDDGTVDESEFDGVNFWPGPTRRCVECHGTGVVRWCPECGHDLNLYRLIEEFHEDPMPSDGI